MFTTLSILLCSVSSIFLSVGLFSMSLEILSFSVSMLSGGNSILFKLIPSFRMSIWVTLLLALSTAFFTTGISFFSTKVFFFWNSLNLVSTKFAFSDLFDSVFKVGRLLVLIFLLSLAFFGMKSIFAFVVFRGFE